MFFARIVLLKALFLAGCVFTVMSVAAPPLTSNEGEGAEAAIERSLVDHQQQQRPIGIVIMAQGRSGSTMLGETFRQNKVQLKLEPTYSTDRTPQQFYSQCHM